MSEVYAIIDLDGYVKEMRLAVARSIASDSQDNLDDYISLGQMKSLVESWCVGHDSDDRPMLDEESNQHIFEDTMVWMTNVGLAKLAAEGMVECAWDNEADEMVFWVSEDKSNEKARKDQRTKGKDK